MKWTQFGIPERQGWTLPARSFVQPQPTTHQPPNRSPRPVTARNLPIDNYTMPPRRLVLGGRWNARAGVNAVGVKSDAREVIEFVHVNGCMQGSLSLRPPIGPCLNLTRLLVAQAARGSEQDRYAPRMMDWPLVYQRQPNAGIVWITEWRIEVGGNRDVQRTGMSVLPQERGGPCPTA